MTRIALTRYSLPLDEQPHPGAFRDTVHLQWTTWANDIIDLIEMMEDVGAESVVIHGWAEGGGIEVELYDPDNVLTEEPA